MARSTLIQISKRKHSQLKPSDETLEKDRNRSWLLISNMRIDEMYFNNVIDFLMLIMMENDVFTDPHLFTIILSCCFYSTNILFSFMMNDFTIK